MRHVVNVMRPAPPQGEGGQLSSPTVLMKEVRCTIEPLNGREAERMQQMYAAATLKVGMYGNPSNPLKSTDWLIDGSGKRLNIMHINDKQRNGLSLELICGEEVA